MAFELRHLRYVVAASSCGSFRRAALSLGVEQSAISRRIRDLEDELGASLFNRHSGGVILTHAGKKFVRHARQALSEVSCAAADVGPIGRGEEGVVQIGVFSSLASGFLAQLLRAYSQRYGGVRIDIVEAAPSDHIPAVRQFRLDIAFVVGRPQLRDCDTADFWTERIYVVLPEHHPLATLRAIRWQELRGETFILSEQGLGSEVANFLVKHLGGVGVSPHMEWHRVGRDNLMQLVALGRGVTLTSEASIAMPFRGIVYRPLQGEILTFCAIWSSQNDNSADAAGTPVRVDEMTYDTRGNMTSLRMAVGTPLERVKTYEYEPDFSNVTKLVDFDGFETTYEYDTFGDLIRMVDAEANVSTYEYNIVGLISRSVDERGQVMSYNYDTRFNVVDMIHPDLSFDRNIYDDRGNVIERIESFGQPEQRSLIVEYDIEDRIISQEMTDAAGVSIDGKAFYEYDIAGNLTATTDETGLRTQYIFDEMNQQVAETSPAYGEMTFAYNGSSEMISETDAEGITRTWNYDIVGRMIQTVDGVGNVSIFEYDVSDNLNRVTDGRGNVTDFGFDILERRISRTNPLNQTIQMSYDKRDNLVQVIRETGDIETATYDGLSRRTSVTTIDNTLSYSYDEESNLIAANDDDSGLTMTYDNRDRLETVTTDGTVGPQPAVTLSYAYDTLNQRQSLTDGLGGVWAYGFDEKSRVANITAPWGDTHSIEYDPAGRRTELVNTTGRQTVAAYASDRLAQLEHFQNAIPIARSGFAYAPDGAVSVLHDIEDATQSRTLAYDGINRLLQVAEGTPAADGGAPIPVEDFAYDEVGNRTASHISSAYTVDDHNRLLEDDTYTYGYDEKGNRVTRTRKSDNRVETFTYNSVNQLVAVTSTDGLDAAYAYDALGRRIAKTVNGDVTAYVYDIGNMYDITGHDRLLDFENGTLAKRWLHGQRIDEPVGFEAYTSDTTAGAGVAYALHSDRQGSVIAVTEQATDTVVSRYVYDAFGAREQTVSTVLQDYGFTGREFDSETGLYYYRARHYDPAQGRFIQSDPLGFAAGDLNLYAYTWNDPANWSDPSGLKGNKAGRAAAGGAAGGYAGAAASSAAMALRATATVGRGAVCAAGKISSALHGLGQIVEAGNTFNNITGIASLGTVACRVKVNQRKKNDRPNCGCGAASGRGKPSSSFPEGTEVLTPTGRVAIETLREGDLVIGRNEDTGQSGVFPVTALMSRTSPDVIWLTLENEAGKTTRMGVTSEHPMFMAGDGWTRAGDIAPGDAIRDKDLRPLTVLAVELDDTPTRVHNLEIAEAHTYFAGELEAWGHNSRSGGIGDAIKCKSIQDALQQALDFIQEQTGEPFISVSSEASKWGAGAKYRGKTKGTEIRVETDGNHGSHVNATCHTGKRAFEFPGGLPGWAKRGL